LTGVGFSFGSFIHLRNLGQQDVLESQSSVGFVACLQCVGEAQRIAALAFAAFCGPERRVRRLTSTPQLNLPCLSRSLAGTARTRPLPQPRTRATAGGCWNHAVFTRTCRALKTRGRSLSTLSFAMRLKMNVDAPPSGGSWKRLRRRRTSQQGCTSRVGFTVSRGFDFLASTTRLRLQLSVSDLDSLFLLPARGMSSGASRLSTNSGVERAIWQAFRTGVLVKMLLICIESCRVW